MWTSVLHGCPEFGLWILWNNYPAPQRPSIWWFWGKSMRVWFLLALNFYCTENYYCIYHCLKLRNRWCIDMIVTISKKLNILCIFTYCTLVKTNIVLQGIAILFYIILWKKNNIYRLFSEQKQIIFRWLDEIVFF